MEAVSDPDHPLTFQYEKETEVFKNTFNILQNSLGILAFSFANRGRDTLTRGFSTNHFEAITMGIQQRLCEFNPADIQQKWRPSSQH